MSPHSGSPDPIDLSVRDKARLGSGRSFWETESVAGLPAAMLTDGPHGVRAQQDTADHLGLGESAPATCFPPAAGLAQSWDPALVERIGGALADEARSLGVGVLLGPGVNIKRDPRCGRNFEYFSEDPLLSGVLGTAWVKGLQAGGVGASVKHFAANNVEADRMRSDSRVAARPLREIYLRAFERVVTEARPWTVMCAYNKINGVYASQNPWLLTEMLRGEWGFDGLVVSDWGAVDDRVAALRAGLDLAMPGGNSAMDNAVVAAVESGQLDAATLDASAVRVLDLLRRAAETSAQPRPVVDADAHHALAREAAARCIVLLKNADAVLPLSRDERVAVIGPFATQPRYQGGGSSHVNPTRVDVPLDEIRGRSAATVTHHPGVGDGDPAALQDDATAAAAAADVAVVFLGLSDADESEGYDRDGIDLPADQLDLLRTVAEAQPRTVVVLSHGGVVDLAEVDRLAAAVLDGALLGQGGGAAIADVLFGEVNPSGRLAETVPRRLQDAPSYLNFPGEHSRVLYGEGVFVGYRGYDARELDVTYPFGHGLSYTDFQYRDLEADLVDDGVSMRVDVANVGPCDGRDAVQVYVSKPGSAVARPPRELRGFAGVDVAAGATESVTIRIARRDLAYWDDRVDAWVVEDGDYTLHVGRSSRNILATCVVRVAGDAVELPVTEHSTIGEVLAHPVAGPTLAALFAEAMPAGQDGLGTDMAKMVESIPLGRLSALGFGPAGAELVQRLTGA